MIGKKFDVPQMANMLEGGRTPLLTPAELHALGFAMVAYPTSLIFRVARTLEKALAKKPSAVTTVLGVTAGATTSAKPADAAARTLQKILAALPEATRGLR